MRLSLSLFAALAASLAAAGHAFADVDVAIGNGDKVQGSFSPADEVEVFRVRIPAGASVSISVRGKKAKGQKTAPSPMLELFAGKDIEATGLQKGTSAKIKKHVVTKRGEFEVRVTGDGVNTGNYDLKVKWKARKTFKMDVTATGAGVTVPFDAGEGAVIGFSVKAKKSDALPQLVSIFGVDADETTALPARQGPAGKSDKEKKFPSPGLDAYQLRIVSGGPDGLVAVKVKVKQAKPTKRKIAITDKQIGEDGGDSFALGQFIDEGGGGFFVDDEENAEIAGAGINVPREAIDGEVLIVIGTAPEVELDEDEDLEGNGPPVFFGPEGLRFESDVTATIPFDPTGLDSDFSAVRIFQRDANGKLQLVDPDSYVFNESDRTVSFPIRHFTAFQAFSPRKAAEPAAGDLNGDGIADLVVNAPEANGGIGAVYVFFGGPALQSSSTADADVVITGNQAGDLFGGTVAVADVNGDGHGDLIATAIAPVESSVRVFFGGVGFDPASAAAADVEIDQQAGDFELRILAVGDATGDGISDILLGAEDGGPSNEGLAYLMAGGTGLISSATDFAASTLIGEAAGDLFGAAGAIGDVDDDQIPDIVIGADMVDSPLKTGRVYVFAGSSFALTDTGANADIILSGDNAGDGFGLPLAVGDVTGDQIDDIIVTRGEDVTGATTSVHVFLGGTGLTSTSAGSSDITIMAESVDDKFGARIVIGDFTGGPIPDLLIGAPLQDGPEVDMGAVYLFEGGAPLFVTSSAAAATGKFFGEAMGNLYGVLAPAADVFGEGTDAIIAFAPGESTGGTAAGRAYVMRTFDAPDAADVIITGRAGEFLGSDND